MNSRWLHVSAPLARLLIAATLCVSARMSAAPAVVGFSPGSGPPGTQVTVTGTGFSSATQVAFDNELADFQVLSATRLIATVPVEGRTGLISVRDASSTGASSGTFTVSPRITDFDPGRGATGTVVTLNGFNLLNTTGVWFGDTPAAFTPTAQTQLRITVPTGATNGFITVANPVGWATSATEFTVIGPAPVVDSFSPAVGAPGATVVLRGVNFSNPVTVKFNGVTDPTASAPATTQINAKVPASATTGKISVQTAKGTFVTTNNFVVTTAPVITNFYPAIGVAGQTRLTIEGVNFATVNNVKVAGAFVGGIERPAPGVLVVTVPPAATNGPVRVDSPSGTNTSAGIFLATRAPFVTELEPDNGAPLANIVVRGMNFLAMPGGVTVRFNGKAAVNPFVAADTQINVQVPSGATTGFVTVSNAAGVGTSPVEFSVTGNAPYVTGANPNPAPRGTTVIIEGKNFFSPLVVRFNGVVAGATSTALTQILTTVPANATTGPLTVTTSAGTNTVQPIFFVPPRLASISPTGGVVGSSLVLTGLNFVAVSNVSIGATPTAFTVSASNRITTVVPAGALPGRVRVETAGGVVLSTNIFQVLPEITGFAPAAGPAGTLVTLTGTTFDGLTGVTFNNVPATVTNATSSQVQAFVPASATTGLIRLVTTNGTAASATNFTVTTASDLSLRITASATLLPPNAAIGYALLVSNKGPSAVTSVRVTNTYPAGFQFTGVQPVPETWSYATNTRVFTWSLPALAGTSSDAVTVNGRYPIEGVYTATATAKAAESDPAPSNNNPVATVTILSDASRTLSTTTIPGGGLVVSWPVSPVPLILQTNSNLALTNGWQPSLIQPGIAGGMNVVTNPAPAANLFLRLAQ